MARRCCDGEGLGCSSGIPPCKECYAGGCAELGGEIVEELPFEDFIAVIFLVHDVDNPEATENFWTGGMREIHEGKDDVGNPSNFPTDPIFKQTPGEFRPVIYDIHIGPYFYGRKEDYNGYVIPYSDIENVLYTESYGIQGTPTAVSRSEALEFGVKIGQTAGFKDSFSCGDFDPICKCIGGHEMHRDWYDYGYRSGYDSRQGNATLGPYRLPQYADTRYLLAAWRSPYVTADKHYGNHEGYMIHGRTRKSRCGGQFVFDDDCEKKEVSMCCTPEKNIKISFRSPDIFSTSDKDYYNQHVETDDEGNTNCIRWSPRNYTEFRSGGVMQHHPFIYPPQNESREDEYGGFIGIGDETKQTWVSNYLPTIYALKAYGGPSASPNYSTTRYYSYYCTKCDLASFSVASPQAKISYTIATVVDENGEEISVVEQKDKELKPYNWPDNEEVSFYYENTLTIYTHPLGLPGTREITTFQTEDGRYTTGVSYGPSGLAQAVGRYNRFLQEKEDGYYDGKEFTVPLVAIQGESSYASGFPWVDVYTKIGDTNLPGEGMGGITANIDTNRYSGQHNMVQVEGGWASFSAGYRAGHRMPQIVDGNLVAGGCGMNVGNTSGIAYNWFFTPDEPEFITVINPGSGGGGYTVRRFCTNVKTGEQYDGYKDENGEWWFPERINDGTECYQVASGSVWGGSTTHCWTDRCYTEMGYWTTRNSSYTVQGRMGLRVGSNQGDIVSTVNFEGRTDPTTISYGPTVGALAVHDAANPNGFSRYSINTKATLTGVTMEGDLGQEIEVDDNLSSYFSATMDPSIQPNLLENSRTKISVTIVSTSQKAVDLLRQRAESGVDIAPVENRSRGSQQIPACQRFCEKDKNLANGAFNATNEILKALNEVDDQGNNPNIVYFDKQVIADVHKNTCGFKEMYELNQFWDTHGQGSDPNLDLGVQTTPWKAKNLLETAGVGLWINSNSQTDLFYGTKRIFAWQLNNERIIGDPDTFTDLDIPSGSDIFSMTSSNPAGVVNDNHRGELRGHEVGFSGDGAFVSPQNYYNLPYDPRLTFRRMDELQYATDMQYLGQKIMMKCASPRCCDAPNWNDVESIEVDVVYTAFNPPSYAGDDVSWQLYGKGVVGTLERTIDREYWGYSNATGPGRNSDFTNADEISAGYRAQACYDPDSEIARSMVDEAAGNYNQDVVLYYGQALGPALGFDTAIGSLAEMIPIVKQGPSYTVYSNPAFGGSGAGTLVSGQYYLEPDDCEWGTTVHRVESCEDYDSIASTGYGYGSSSNYTHWYERDCYRGNIGWSVNPDYNKLKPGAVYIGVGCGFSIQVRSIGSQGFDICEPRDQKACTWYGNLQAIQDGNLDINNVRRVPQIGTTGRNYTTVDFFNPDTGQGRLSQYCRRTIEYYDQIKNVPKTGAYAAMVTYAEHAVDGSLPPTGGLYGEYTWDNVGGSYTGNTKHERIYTYENGIPLYESFFPVGKARINLHPDSPLAPYFAPVDPYQDFIETNGYDGYRPNFVDGIDINSQDSLGRPTIWRNTQEIITHRQKIARITLHKAENPSNKTPYRATGSFYFRASQTLAQLGINTKAQGQVFRSDWDSKLYTDPSQGYGNREFETLDYELSLEVITSGGGANEKFDYIWKWPMPLSYMGFYEIGNTSDFQHTTIAAGQLSKNNLRANASFNNTPGGIQYKYNQTVQTNLYNALRHFGIGGPIPNKMYAAAMRIPPVTTPYQTDSNNLGNGEYNTGYASYNLERYEIRLSCDVDAQEEGYIFNLTPERYANRQTYSSRPVSLVWIPDYSHGGTGGAPRRSLALNKPSNGPQYLMTSYGYQTTNYSRITDTPLAYSGGQLAAVGASLTRNIEGVPEGYIDWASWEGNIGYFDDGATPDNFRVGGMGSNMSITLSEYVPMTRPGYGGQQGYGSHIDEHLYPWDMIVKLGGRARQYDSNAWTGGQYNNRRGSDQMISSIIIRNITRSGE